MRRVHVGIYVEKKAIEYKLTEGRLRNLVDHLVNGLRTRQYEPTVSVIEVLMSSEGASIAIKAMLESSTTSTLQTEQLAEQLGTALNEIYCSLALAQLMSCEITATVVQAKSVKKTVQAKKAQ